MCLTVANESCPEKIRGQHLGWEALRGQREPVLKTRGVGGEYKRQREHGRGGGHPACVLAPAVGQASRKFSPSLKGADGQMGCLGAGALTHSPPSSPAHLNHGVPLVAQADPSAQLGNIKNLAPLAACIRASGPFSCCCCQMLMGLWEASEECVCSGPG